MDGSRNWGNEQDITRLIKGIYKIKPPLPKYTFTWDAEQLLNFIELLVPLEKLNLKELTLKTFGLIALKSGTRAQTMHLMDLDLMEKT